MGRPKFILDRANLGQDPEFFEVGRDNVLQCQLNLASTPRYFDKKKDEWTDGKTTWIRASAWDYQAELIDSMQLQKGDTVYVEGSFEENQYTDKDGIERYGFNFRIDKLFLIPKLSKEDFDGYDQQDSGSSRTPVKNRRSRSSGSSRTKRSSRGSGGSRRKSRSSSGNSRLKKKSGGSLADKVRQQLNK